MVKKLLTIAMSLGLAISTMAQWGGNPVVPQDSIRFWTGTGSNRAVIAITWEDASEDMIGIAWGVQWNGGSIQLMSLMDTIAAYDSRLTVTLSSTGSLISNMAFNDSELGLSLLGTPDWWWYCWTAADGTSLTSTSVGPTGDMIQNGQFVDWLQMGSADIMLYAENPDDATPEVVDATIDFADILYWVGTGSNEVVLAINWADTALAWGYRFNSDSVLVGDIVEAIAAADPRFSYEGSTSFISDFLYADSVITDTLRLTPHDPFDYSIYFNMAVNHVASMLGAGAHKVVNGDFVKFADTYVAVKVDSTWYNDWGGYWDYTYAWPMTIHPVSVPDDTPAVEDASIAASDILFWVGHGENEVVMAINWADTALAWGYRFDSDSVLVGDIVEAIATADPRFSYEGSPSYISDFLYADSLITDTLRLTPHDPFDYSIYFNMTVNHVASMLGAGAHKVVNGDFVKFADTYVAVKVDSTWYEDWGGYWDYTYAWPMTIHPVSVPDTAGSVTPVDPEHGPFCGAVGTEGCTAIAADSSAIVAWATGVSVTRGPRNIANPALGVAGTGEESNAVGPATSSDVYDVVSLGDGGTALATFAHPIRNGEGPDFAVFENGFSDNSLELAFVEVSTDGQRFVRFPATCLTQTETQLGNAGQTDPTNINNLAGKFRIGYGTPFDLEELRDSTGINIDSIVYVRIVDVVGSIDPEYATYDAFGHIVNDPWPTPFESSGYDLTGIAVMYENINTSAIDDAQLSTLAIYPNPTADIVTVSGVQEGSTITLFDITGRVISQFSSLNSQFTIDLTSLNSGIYMLRSGDTVSKIVKR